MNTLIDNWYMIVATICIVAMTVRVVVDFKQKPTEEQIKAVKKWLLIAVTECEAQLGSKTGRLKL